MVDLVVGRPIQRHVPLFSGDRQVCSVGIKLISMYWMVLPLTIGHTDLCSHGTKGMPMIVVSGTGKGLLWGAEPLAPSTEGGQY